MTLTFTQGDTAPAITGAITHQNDNSALDLTGASVKFQMRKADDRRFTVNATASVINASTGSVGYDWAPNDLATPGDYLVQWEITFSGGRIQTTSQNTITVRRQ